MVVGGLLCLSGLRGCLDHLALPDGKGGCTRLDTHRMHRAREDLVSRVLGEHLRRQLLLGRTLGLQGVLGEKEVFMTFIEQI